MTRNHRRAGRIENRLRSSRGIAGDTTRTSAGENQPLGAGNDGGARQGSVHVFMRVEDVDFREGGKVADIEVRLTNGFGGGVVEVGDLVDEEAELAGFGAVESVEGVGVVLGGVESAADAVGQGDHGAAVTGVGGSGEGDGLVEVERTVGAEGGGGAHGSDYDDGFGGVDDHVEEEGGFFQGVGSVCDYDSGDFWFGEFGVDCGADVEQDGAVDIFAGDVGDLNAIDIRHIQDFWDSIDELLDTEPDRIANCLGIGCSLTCNRTAGRKDGYIWQARVDRR